MRRAPRCDPLATAPRLRFSTTRGAGRSSRPALTTPRVSTTDFISYRTRADPLPRSLPTRSTARLPTHRARSTPARPHSASAPGQPDTVPTRAASPLPRRGTPGPCARSACGSCCATTRRRLVRTHPGTGAGESASTGSDARACHGLRDESLAVNAAGASQLPRAQTRASGSNFPTHRAHCDLSGARSPLDRPRPVSRTPYTPEPRR